MNHQVLRHTHNLSLQECFVSCFLDPIFPVNCYDSPGIWCSKQMNNHRNKQKLDKQLKHFLFLWTIFVWLYTVLICVKDMHNFREWFSKKTDIESQTYIWRDGGWECQLQNCLNEKYTSSQNILKDRVLGKLGFMCNKFTKSKDKYFCPTWATLEDFYLSQTNYPQALDQARLQRCLNEKLSGIFFF